MEITLPIFASSDLKVVATTKKGGLMVQVPYYSELVFVPKRMTCKFFNASSTQYIVLYENWKDLSQEKEFKKVPVLNEYVK